MLGNISLDTSNEILHIPERPALDSALADETKPTFDLVEP